jgi:hypothetical protein
MTLFLTTPAFYLFDTADTHHSGHRCYASWPARGGQDSKDVY